MHQTHDQTISEHIGVKLPDDQRSSPMSSYQVHVDSFQKLIDKCQLLPRLAQTRILDSLASSWIQLIGRGTGGVVEPCSKA